jgi:DNA-binding transcriptional LysR family regulator
MPQLNEIAAFVAVSKFKSYTLAAKETQIPKSTLSRQVFDLEGRLGVSLLARTTRTVHLTPAGEKYFATCSRLLEELNEVENETTLEQKTATGHLRFTAPMEVGTHLLPSVLKKFADKYPQITFECDYSDRIVNLVEEGYDLALRAGRLKDSSLIAKKIGGDQFILVAAPDYLNGAADLRKPEDLVQHRCLIFRSGKTRMLWHLKSNERRVTVKVPEKYIVSSLSAISQMAKTGHGVAFIPAYLVQDSLLSGELKKVLPQWTSDKGHYYLVYPPQKHLPLRLRVFIEFLHAELKQAIVI